MTVAELFRRYPRHDSLVIDTHAFQADAELAAVATSVIEAAGFTVADVDRDGVTLQRCPRLATFRTIRRRAAEDGTFVPAGTVTIPTFGL